MSRRALSYTTPKASVSPSKTASKLKQSKQVHQTDPQLPPISPSSSPNNQFISALQQKLKEKYSNLSFALKKISDSFPIEIPLSQFKLLLKDLKLKYTEKDFQEFFKQYGKPNKTLSLSTIPLQSLAKCVIPNLLKLASPRIKKKITLIRTQSFSTRSSTKTLGENVSSLNLTIPYQPVEESPYIKVQEKEVFFSALLEKFSCPETATDYFFIDRDYFLNFEEFFDSANTLGVNSNIDLLGVFKELTQKKDALEKKEFFDNLFYLACKDLDDVSLLIAEFRSRLHSLFTTHVRAFQEIAGNKSYVSLNILEEVSDKLGMNLRRSQLVEMFSRYQSECQLRFKDFKCFWLGKEGICAVKSCEESVAHAFSYCSAHFKCLSNRGEEIFSKLQLILKQQQLLSLTQEILKDEKKKGYLVNGFELQKKDVQALKEFLKIHGFSKQRLVKSVKNRVS